MPKQFKYDQNPPDWPLTISYDRFINLILSDYGPYSFYGRDELSLRGIDTDHISNPYLSCVSKLPEQIPKLYKKAILHSDRLFARRPNTQQAKAADYYRDAIGLVLDALNKAYGRRFGKVVTSITNLTPNHEALINKYKAMRAEYA